MTPYKLAIFDFDGTLADSSAWMLVAFTACADKFGFRKLSRDEIEALRGQDNRAILCALELPMWKLPAIAKHVRAMAAEAEPPPLFAGAPDALRALKASGLTLGVVSSNSEYAIRRALGPELAALIDHYACDASIFGKPGKFRQLIKAARVKRAEVVAVGDETRDIEAARKAGVACAAVTWGYATERVLRDFAPDFVFASMEDMAAQLGAMADAGRAGAEP